MFFKQEIIIQVTNQRLGRYLYMKKISVILLIMVIAGCMSDVVSDTYATYEDAKADNLFNRGWLPEFIPKSSKNIIVKNNLDLNTSIGEFTIDPKDSKGFIAQLTLLENTKNDYIKYIFSKGTHSWIFIINLNNGHVKYRLD